MSAAMGVTARLSAMSLVTLDRWEETVLARRGSHFHER